MKNVLRVFLIAICLVNGVSAMEQSATAYDYTFKVLHQKDTLLPLSAYKGKVLLVVNTASECGFTPQFKELETLYQTYKDQGLVIVGVPSNDFGGQDPGSSADIEKVCRYNYGVTFPMAEKEIVTGKNAHPFYQWAHAQLGFGSSPKWNFHKYLIDRNGKAVGFYFSTTSPLSDKINKAVQAELARQTAE